MARHPKDGVALGYPSNHRVCSKIGRKGEMGLRPRWDAADHEENEVVMTEWRQCEMIVESFRGRPDVEAGEGDGER